MELYEFVFEKLLDVLTCSRCKDLFSNPVIMDCEHNICLSCVEDITSKENEEGGSYRCPLCLRQGELKDYIYNRQLGTVAAVTNTMKQVISVGYNTVRKLTGDRDSMVRSENARSKASFITRHSLGSRHPTYMTPGGALLRNFTMELYRSAFEKVVDVLTCQWCKNLFWDPIMMDCGHNVCLPCAADIESKEEGGCYCPLCGYKQVPGYSCNHQLSKAAVLANVMKEIISGGDSTAPRVNSDRDIRVRSEDAYSSASTELPCSMERYKSVFETLMDVLTCPWCKGMFNEPVIMECGHNFCKTCSGYILSKDEKEGGCCYCPLCQAELKPEKYIYNSQLGKAAVVAKVVKDVVPWWYITVPRMASQRNSRVRSADEQSEVSFVARHSKVSMEPPPNMELCSSAIESLVDVLTCQRCKNLFTDPVIMNCGHSSCLSCTANESTEEGGWHCPQCQDEQSLDYSSNHQLGKAALVVTVIKKVMSGGSSTAPGLTSGQDSGVESEDAGSEASFVTGYSMPSMEPPPTMAPYKGFTNKPRSLPGSVGSPYFMAGMEPPLGMVPDKIRKRTYSPYSMGSPCSVANMEPPLSMVSDKGFIKKRTFPPYSGGSPCSIPNMDPPPSMVPDKGFIKKRTFSPYSVGASYSVGSPCSIPNMEPPPSMVPDKEFIKKRTFSPYSVGTAYSVGSPCSMPNMEPPHSMVPGKEFIKERTFSPYSVESGWSVAGPEPPPSMDPGAEFEGMSFPGDHEGSEYL